MIKTGSTWLQDHVFLAPDSVRPSTGFHCAAPAARAHLVDRIVLRGGFAFDPAAGAAYFRGLQVNKAGSVPVWSDETMLGDPLTRRYDGPSSLEKLKACFPDARVLMVIREQRSIALSMFNQYVKEGGALTATDFFGTGDEPLSFSPILRADFLEYDRAISKLHELFGPENCLVMPQELLRRSPGDFLARLAAFCEVEAAALVDAAESNRAPPQATQAMRRRLNRLFVASPLQPAAANRGRRWLLRGTAIIGSCIPAYLHRAMRRRLEAQIRARFEGAYGPSNRRAQELTGIDLSAFDYDLV
ncbi:MAG: hypothetical protein ACON4Z_11835 [Planctomycetota bacterium]